MPDDVSTIAGDAIHNFRAVLDHWVEQFSVAQAGHPVSKTGLPILTDKADWEKAGKARQNCGAYKVRQLPDVERPVK